MIGVLGGMADARGVFGPSARLVVFLGVLGGFTTFSTFAYETLALLRDGEALSAGALPCRFCRRASGQCGEARG